MASPRKQRTERTLGPIVSKLAASVPEVIGLVAVIAGITVLAWSFWPSSSVAIRVTGHEPLLSASLEGPKAGSGDARVVVVEFSDFECPYCGIFARNTEDSLFQQYVTTGKVMWVFRHLPLDVHKSALRAAIAASCAEADGKFWPMRKSLFDNQRDLSDAALERRAAAIGLSLEGFATCMRQYPVAVQRDLTEALALGISSTPTFLIGTRDGGSTMRVVRTLSGALPAADFQRALDPLLAGREASAVIKFP